MNLFKKNSQEDDFDELNAEQQETEAAEEAVVSEDTASADTADIAEEEKPKRERIKPRPNKGTRAIKRFLNGVFGIGLVTAIIGGIALLSLEYIVVKGPSESLRDKFVMTMLETRRFDFVANIFLTEAEVKEIQNSSSKIATGKNNRDVNRSDSSMISIAAKDESVQIVDETGTDAYGLVDDDGDGIIFVNVKGSGFQGYMIVVLDPTRVFVGMPDYYGGNGLTLSQYVEKYDAIGGINAGGFKDDNGGGSGGEPEGLTIIDGEYYNAGSGESAFAGLDEDGVLHVGYFSEYAAQAKNIKYGVSFGPLLIVNGKTANLSKVTSGVNPRTAIAQRADGAIMMLVIDGRQVQSMGATYLDVIELLLSYGAVNACNMDGGSSTCMYYNGEYVNSNSSASGERLLPNAFLFK